VDLAVAAVIQVAATAVAAVVVDADNVRSLHI
jgi:hypothetical protein